MSWSDPDLKSAVRLWIYCPWAGRPTPAAGYLAGLPAVDLTQRLGQASDPRLLRIARLDCDWQGENVRCLAELSQPGVEFRPAQVLGAAGLGEYVGGFASRPSDETWWLVFTGQQPGELPAGVAAKVAAFTRRNGGRVLFYAYDEVSRSMPGFRTLAPHLDVLIHDEQPLDPVGASLLSVDCVTIHRSWVANVVPFSHPCHETPTPSIYFLGSQLGLTPHRERQIAFLRTRFKDRFVASTDHSVEVTARAGLNRHQVAFCPEGRKFATPAMRRTHTDRPFWAGCLGMVPVAENSRAGDRLDELAQSGLIVRYPHGNLAALAEACERALTLPPAARRRIHAHFNTHETIGVVVAGAIAAAQAQVFPVACAV
jgi:hypothetical protein